MKSYNVEVAVAFTDRTWSTTMTTVEDFPSEVVEKVAEEKVLEDFSHGLRAIAFVKAIWVGPEEEE